jgi:hypothetical protein
LPILHEHFQKSSTILQNGSFDYLGQPLASKIMPRQSVPILSFTQLPHYSTQCCLQVDYHIFRFDLIDIRFWPMTTQKYLQKPWSETILKHLSLLSKRKPIHAINPFSLKFQLKSNNNASDSKIKVA